MRKTLLAIVAVALFSGNALAASVDVGDAMDDLADHYKAALKAENPQDFKQALEGMKTAANEAKQGTPPKLEKEAADSEKMKDYHHGFDVLIGQIDKAEQLADAGQFAQAKQEAENFKETRNTYHKKYK